jgi:hypothetical protein
LQVVLTCECFSAWASVLAQMNSTPSIVGAQHVVDGVAATTTDTHHLDDRALGHIVYEFKHGRAPVLVIVS